MAVLIESTNDGTTTRKILLDAAAGFSNVEADGAWKRSDAVNEWKRQRIQTDLDDTVYLPIFDGGAGVNLLAIDSDGVNALQFVLDAPVGDNFEKLDPSFPDGVAYEAFAVTFTTEAPDHTDDTNSRKPEFLYLAVQPEVTRQPSVAKIRLVRRRLTQGDPRASQIVAIAEGDIKVIDPDAAIGSQVEVATDGDNVLDIAAEFGTMQSFFGELFVIDGESNLVYTPATKTVRKWVAETRGSLPNGCRLMTAWNARMALARPAGDPHQWFLSGVADPFDWDFSPTPLTVAQAISGSDSRAGACPDIINALAPWSDDLLVFGCDSTIQRLTGDPLRDGRFDLVTDQTGMAFGDAWCKDDQDTMYFLGAQMGIWMMVPGAKPVEISKGRVEDLLRVIDLDRYQARMFWNQEDRTVHLFVVNIPDANGRTTFDQEEVSHLVYERDLDAWHVDRFGGSEPTNREPQHAFVSDGPTENDRSLLLCCADGTIRRWDKSANTDDGENIGVRLQVGPIRPRGLVGRFRYDRPSITLSPDSGTGDLYMLTSDDPHLPGVEFGRTSVMAGFNDRLAITGKGRFGWLLLLDATGGRLAVDGMSIEATYAGR